MRLLLIAGFHVLAAGLVAQAQGLQPCDFPRDVPVSVAQEAEWSWCGLPQGEQQAWGVTYELPAADGTDSFAAAAPQRWRVLVPRSFPTATQIYQAPRQAPLPLVLSVQRRLL